MNIDDFRVTIGSSGDADEIIREFARRACRYSDEISLYLGSLTDEQADCLNDEDMRSISNIVGNIPVVKFARALEKDMSGLNNRMHSQMLRFSALRVALYCENSNCSFNNSNICWLTNTELDSDGHCKSYINKVELGNY